MKRLVLFIVFLLLTSTVNAEFSEESAKSWLSDRIVWSQAPIEELSFATMVLNSNTGLSQLNNKKSSLTSTKDVALTALALKYMNQDIGDQLDYLDNSLKAATDFNENEWIIQVVVNEEGSCDITYDGGTHETTFNSEGKIISGGEDSWITFNRLNGFEFDKALEEIDVDCDFSSTPRISIIKKIGNSFYITEEKFSSTANFDIENGCYATNPSSSCDKTSTFYVSWVLNKLSEELTTKNYLRDNANTDIDYAMLADIDSSQLPQLISRQKQDGSFNSAVYETSFAFDAMESSDEKNEAKSWAESKQNEDTGMIGTGTKDTAVSLYLIYTSGIITGDNEDEGQGCVLDSDCQPGYTCNTPTGVCELLGGVECNDNFQCEPNLGENWLNCPNVCFCGDGVCDAEEDITSCSSDCTTEQEPVCGDGICGFGENNNNCASDCPLSGGSADEESDVCGDGICGFGEDCPIDCEVTKKGSLLWLWIVIIVLILGGGAFFVLKKMKKGKGRDETPSYLNPRVPPNYPQPTSRTIARRHPKDQALESELDRSINEAQELLKKK
jgi:hypothetical protein